MRRFAAALAALALTLMAVMPASAVTGNYVKDFEHPYVGLAAFYDQDGAFLWRCSASLLTPSIVLTAGHCTGGATTSRIWFQQDAGTQYDPATQLDLHTGYPNYCIAGDPLCAESDTLYNYGFDNFAGFPDNHDVGIIVLNHPVSTSAISQYAVLAAPGALDYLASNTRRGAPPLVTVSGYGVSAEKPVVVSFRERLMATAQLINTRSSYTDGYNIHVSANVGQNRGGTCFGDSGGPDLWGTTDVVLAVNSFVINGNCAGSGYDYRVDRQAVQDWITDVTGVTLPTSPIS